MNTQTDKILEAVANTSRANERFQVLFDVGILLRKRGVDQKIVDEVLNLYMKGLKIEKSNSN